MEAMAKTSPIHDSMSLECGTDHAEPESQGADPAAVHEYNGEPRGLSSASPRCAAGQASRGLSDTQDIMPPRVDDACSLPPPESTSHPAALGDRWAWPPSTTGEEASDESEPTTPTPRTPPSQTLDETPTASNVAPIPVQNGTASLQAPYRTNNGGQRARQVAPAHPKLDKPDVPNISHPQRRPSALDYLVSVSPSATPRATPQTAYKSARARASHVSGFSNKSAPPWRNSQHGDSACGRALNTVPLLGWTSNYPGLGGAYPGPSYPRPQTFPEAYGSPPIAHSHASFANVTMPPIASSINQPVYGAEKSPMSGYQLLAAKLVGGLGGAPVTPIYRRFEALQHRLLLYMQADLVDLENELRALDTTDTMERGYGAIPASRRHERWTNSTLAQQRTEILGQIGYKLCQYNKVMTSFVKAHSIPAPSLAEIHQYRTYLANNRLIADEEARFLDLPEDLVSLAREELPAAEEPVVDPCETETAAAYMVDEAPVPPPPPSRAEPGSGPGHGSKSAPRRPPRGRDPLGTSLSRLALAMSVAVFVPIATFGIVPDFAGRITIVALVGAGVGTALTQSGLVGLLDRGALDWTACVLAYGAAMAVIAWIIG